MGVDGLCSDYPERVHESNKRLRPQASQTDAATFPFPQGPDCSSGVDLRGLAEDAEAEEAAATNKDGGAGAAADASTVSLSSNSTRGGGSRSSRCGSSTSSLSGSTTTNKAEDSTDATALGGWYSRCDTCEQEGSDQQRLIAALYGDLAGVRDFAVHTVEDAKVLVKVCVRVLYILKRLCVWVVYQDFTMCNV